MSRSPYLADVDMTSISAMFSFFFKDFLLIQSDLSCSINNNKVILSKTKELLPVQN